MQLFNRCEGHFFHDWEVLDCQGEAALRTVVAHSQGRMKGIMYRDYSGAELRFQKKVCLRCGKKVDEITPEIEKIEGDCFVSKDRKRKARELMD